MAISGIVPLTVDFTNTSTGENLSHFWDFGDGNTSMEANPSHIYAVVGDFTVNLTTTNNYGTDTKLDYISVSLGVPFEDPDFVDDDVFPPGKGKGKGKGKGGPPAGPGGPPGGKGKGGPPGGPGKGKGGQEGTGPPEGIYQYGAAGPGKGGP